MADGKSFEPETFTGNGASISIDSPSPSVVVMRFTGNIKRDLVRPLMVSLTRRHSSATEHYFIDAWDLTGYDSSLRTELTTWFMHRRSSVATLNTVTRSKIVSMGIAVAQIALGNLTNHPNRASFEAALAERLAMRKMG